MTMFKYRNSFSGYFKFYYKIVGRRLIVFLLLSVLISGLDGLGLAMFIPLLQSVAQDGSIPSGSFGNFDSLRSVMGSMGIELTITSVLLTMVGLFVFKGLVRFIQLSYYARLRQLFIKRVRFSLVHNMQHLSYSAFLKMDAGTIQNTLTVEVQRLFQTMKSYFDAAQACAMLVTYMLFAFLANFQFALLVAVGAGLSNFIYRKIYKITKKASIELSDKGSNFNSFLTQSTLYFKYLKSTNSFGKYAEKLRGVIGESAGLQRKIGMMNAITNSAKEPIIVIMVTLVMIIEVNWLGGSFLGLILSLMLFYRALTYLIVVQNHWQGFIENIGGMNAVATMLDEMSELKEETGTKVYKSLKREIKLENVTLSFGTRKVLNHVSMTIPKLSTIALVGESGAGKTTLANIVAALIKPTSGRVLIDGVPVTDLDLDSYRNTIGYISQETVIFNDTFYNNITFWDEPTEENIRRFQEVVEIASLHDFLQSNPLKEQTVLGDNGILISGGQKQRISIARELYKQSEILIFDEATSALDSETEKIIQRNIEKLYGRFTMIIIAHRLSTIKTADTIYLLERGQISDFGSFSEMMHSSTRFQNLVSLQTF